MAERERKRDREIERKRERERERENKNVHEKIALIGGFMYIFQRSQTQHDGQRIKEKIHNSIFKGHHLDIQGKHCWGKTM